MAGRWPQAVAVLLLVAVFVLGALRWGLPVLLLPVLAMAALAVLIWPRQSLYALYALVPLSIPFSTMVLGLGADFWFPTEPMAAMLLLLLLLRLLQQRGAWMVELTSEPIFWFIVLFLVWLALAALASTRLGVSAKYMLVRLWFVAIFFYASYLELRKSPQRAANMLWGYIVGMAVVAVYTVLRQHSMGLLDRQVAQHTCTPFFPDHTSYGAALAFALPMALGLARISQTMLARLLALALSALFAVALVLSHTRAAWLGLVIGAGVWMLCLLRMPFRRMLLLAAGSALLVAMAWPQLMRYVRHTEAESTGGLANHARSITNISTDESNVERLNRWSCAWLMFAEKPLLGFGPGTFQFSYAPYQHNRYITLASTNRGDRGGAHSEYLGLLAEGGIVVATLFLMLIASAIVGAMGLAVKLPAGTSRALLMAMLVGFTAYAAHSALNNFLDIDKLAAPFWLTIALVVAMRRLGR